MSSTSMFRRLARVIVIAGLLAPMPGLASHCSKFHRDKPYPPSALTKPSPPGGLMCGGATCTESAIQMHQIAVSDYEARLREYTASVERYARDLEEYTYNVSRDQAAYETCVTRELGR
jgi:hypothetical protein